METPPRKEVTISQVMKKIFLVVSCTLLLVALSSCTTYKLVAPVGLWQSDDPSITLNIANEERDCYGTYVMDGEEIEVYAVFGHVSNLLSIYDAIVVDEDYKGGWDEYTYFGGNWEVRDDKLYLTLKPTWQEMHGIKEIVFTKTADY